MKKSNVFKLFIAIGVTFFLAGVACYNPFLRIKPKNEPDIYREPKGWVVSTLAGSGATGSGNGGFADGQGEEARFNRPEGITVDNAGNVYVAEFAGHRIRKVTPGGMVSTLAGDGTAGFANGQGTAAQFYCPQGVTVDNSGYLYVGDAHNHLIRKITPNGTVSTLAGSGHIGTGVGNGGYVDGAGTIAEFNTPYGIAVDSSGNVYVADVVNRKIRMINKAGYVTTLGDGYTPPIPFNTRDVAIDRAGNIYVADTYRILKITPGRDVAIFAGNGTNGYANGPGTEAKFDVIQGVAVDKFGNVYVADMKNCRIRKITPDGVVSTLAGSGLTGIAPYGGFADGESDVALFNGPWGVAVDNKGNVYVADTYNHCIRKIEPYY